MCYAWLLTVELQICIRAPKEFDGVKEDRLKVLRKILGREWEEVTVVWIDWKNIGPKVMNTPPKSCHPLSGVVTTREPSL